MILKILKYLILHKEYLKQFSLQKQFHLNFFTIEMLKED
jgi:hypothetical protein